jgi:hypothetical protein
MGDQEPDMTPPHVAGLDASVGRVDRSLPALL